MFGFEWNSKELETGLERLDRAMEDAILKALYLAGNTLLGDSLDIVPFDKGYAGGLASTGSVTPPVANFDGQLEVTVGYNKIYAAKLHEDMTLQIKQTHPSNSGAGRQQKYLTKPMQQNTEKYGRILRDGVAYILQ